MAIRDLLVIGDEPARHSGAVYLVEVAGQVAIHSNHSMIKK